MGRPKLFISYSNVDEPFMCELEVQLVSMQRNKEIEIWSNRMIKPGEDWDKIIKSELLDADIILLLVSPDFIASEYCYDIEVKAAIEMHNQSVVKVLPVIIRHCDWQSTLFADIQVLPKDGIPVIEWKHRDEAWLDVVKAIRQVINKNQRRESINTQKDSNPLVDYPVYPMVEAVDFPRILIEEISKTIQGHESEMIVNEANRKRKSVNPGDDNVTIIELYRIQSVNQTSSYEFWIKVIGQARLHGPRMLAALLLTIPDSTFSLEARKEKAILLEKLKHYNQ